MIRNSGEILEQCRTRFGDAPRSFSRWDRWRHLRLEPPRWMLRNQDHQLWPVLNSQKELLANGTVVWAFVLQANALLYEPGKHDHPAIVIYSLDPKFEDMPEELSRVAGSLYDLKSTQQEDPELQEFSRVLADEHDHKLRMPVPRSLVGSFAVFATTILVSRAHLPDRYLRAGHMPLVVHPSTGAAMVLPGRFWPEALLQAWAA